MTVATRWGTTYCVVSRPRCGMPCDSATWFAGTVAKNFASSFLITDIDAATAIGEKIRAAVAGTKFPLLSITLGPKEPHDMLDQADKCLYVAKRNGRNQVVRFDQVPEDVKVDESAVARTRSEESSFESHGTTQVPYRAVAAGVSAFRNGGAQSTGCRPLPDGCRRAAYSERHLHS